MAVMQLFSAPNIIFSLGLMIIGVAKFLDGHTDENWRKRLAAFLRTGKIGGESDRRSKAVKPWQFAAKTMSSFFRDILRSEDAWHFLSLSGAASNGGKMWRRLAGIFIDLWQCLAVARTF